MNARFRLLLSFCAILLLAVPQLDAQEKTIDNILSVQLRNMGAIRNGNTISGYYMFYEVDKVDKKTRAYTLQILDENLEEVTTKRMNNSKYVQLVDAAFNNEVIMLKFYDTKEQKYTYKGYDLKGVRAKGATRKLEKKAYFPPLFAQHKNGANHDGAFFAIPDKGFIQYAGVKNKKWGYIIDFMANSGGKSWKYKSDKASKTLLYTSHIVANENMILVNVGKADSNFGKNARSALLALDVDTGKKRFELDFDNKRPVQIVNGFIDEDRSEIMIFGLYYDEGDNTIKSKSKGIFAYSLDMEGNIKSKEHISWAKDVNKFLKVNQSGKMKDSKYIAFHDAVRTSDGKIVLVGEQYKKKVAGGRIAAVAAMSALAAAAGGGVGAVGGGAFTDFVIDDMMIFQLDASLKLEKIEVIEKGKTTLGLPSDFASPQVLAYYAKSLGGFDYAFTQKNDDQSVVSFGYLDYERSKETKNGYSFGSVNYVDGEVSTDNFKLNRDADWVRIMPAISGYVAIAEITSKKKKGKGLKKKKVNSLNLRLEKINY